MTTNPSIGPLAGIFAEQRDLAEQAANALAPEAAQFEDMDAAGLTSALAAAFRSAFGRPESVARSGIRLGLRLGRIPGAVTRRWLGESAEWPLPVDPKDRRFAAPAWETNPAFAAVRQAYLAGGQFLRELDAAADLDPDTARKADLALGLMLDALAPTNFLPTNPQAWQRAFETGGGSVLRGAKNFLDDLRHNGGKPRQVDASGFEVGKNLACTPAKVVYRNDLMELLQYEPQTDQVRARPLLCSPPWINKYYIMDLAPHRSFIEWAVQHGRTVFAISYRNPGPEMSATTMDDYLISGPQTAINVIQEITGAATIDIVGLCLGGALTAITAAYLIQAGDDRIGTLTLLNTMLDYSDPGALGSFTDAKTVERLERRIRTAGVLEGASMAGTFDVLRANDLIFNYVVSNWLLGQQPPAFDILAWNADSTRLPATMYAFYLRNFYVENQLAAGRLQIAGRTVDLGVITSPTYIVSAINDHIVPWTSAYRSVGLVSGPVRFALGSGGHIAGIVSPPGPKAWHIVADTDELPEDPLAWQRAGSKRTGTWWEDWTTWAEATAGDWQPPPRLGSDQHPPLGPGPGTYVRG